MTARAIDAAWPEWWSRDAEASVSASTELRFTLARHLGLSPSSLLEGQPTFLWRDEAKFKNLSASSAEHQAIASFGVALGRLLITGVPNPEQPLVANPTDLRDAILKTAPVVEFNSVLALAWSFGIPVVSALIRPTERIRMHAMSVVVDGRFAIIVGRRYTHRSHAAYALAHELGHCLLGHLSSAPAIVDLGDPAKGGAVGGDDGEETEADRFALTLLTGSPEPQIQSTQADYTATQLAQAAMSAAGQSQVDAGVLALCLGHATGQWPKTFGALKVIPPGREEVRTIINRFAWSQIDRDVVSDAGIEYLEAVIGAA